MEKEKKLLILGGAYLHEKVVVAAREMGIYTIVTDNNINAPAKKIADKSYDIDVSDVDAIVQMAKEEEISAVISVCLDFCQVYYQRVCEKLNLPCWGTNEQFEILTKKQVFKKKCREYGVDIIPGYTEDDIFQNSSDIEYPILVKPSESRGSRGQTICNNCKEAMNAIERAKVCSVDKNVIIEKYMGEKPDFQVTYLIIDGEPYIVRTADRYLGNPAFGLDRVAVALCSPSKYSKLFIDKANERIIKLLLGIGLKNAPVFFQGFIDGDAVRLYDPGLRFPGGNYDRTFAEVMGLDLMKILIEFAFMGKSKYAKQYLMKSAYNLNNKIIFTLHCTIREGEIREIVGKEKIMKTPGVRGVNFRHLPGDKIASTGDVNQRLAEVNICGESIEDIISTVHAVQNSLKVLDDNGKDMIICKFNTDNLRKVANGSD